MFSKEKRSSLFAWNVGDEAKKGFCDIYTIIKIRLKIWEKVREKKN